MNKSACKVSFSKVTNTFIAVPENAVAQGKSGYGTVRSRGARCTRSALKMTLLGAAVAALTGTPGAARAQMVAYKNGGSAVPKTEKSANGYDLVQIVTPNAAGLSHNKFDQFNVGTTGAILNNSAATVQTQLGGYIGANPNLRPGQSAGVILNEVMSTSRSLLNGYIEVAGQRADVVVANPNGISVGGGAGFINASRGVLSTGMPVINNAGQLSAFKVSQGDIAVETGGMNAAGTARLDLITRSVRLNDNLWARELNVITGSNQVDYAGLGVQKAGSVGNAPAAGIDSSALGGMYAEKIVFVGTEAGIGVRALGSISASAGDIRIDSRGKVFLNGSTGATGQISVRSDDDISNSGVVYAQQSVALQTAGQLANSGTLAAQSHLSVDATSINSTGALAAGVDGSGRALQSGNLSLRATGMIGATGRNTAGNNIDMSGSGIDLTSASSNAGGAARLSATAGNIDHSLATLQSSGSAALTATGAVINEGGTIKAEQLAATARSLRNSGGSMIQSGTDQMNLQVTDLFDNAGGLIATNGRLGIDAGTLSNQSGVIGSDEAVQIAARAVNNQSGQIFGKADLTLLASRGDVDNSRNGYIGAAGVRLQVAGDLINTAGKIEGLESGISVSANSVNNSAGTIQSLGNARLGMQLAQTLQNGTQNNVAGFIGSAGDIDVDAAAIDNAGGMLYSKTRLQLHSDDALANSAGVIQSDGTLQVTADGLLDNRYGRIEANGNSGSDSALTVHAAQINNNSGRIAGSGRSSATVGSMQGLSNAAGLIGSNGDLVLQATGLDNSGQGQVLVAGRLDLQIATALNNNQGILYAGQNLTLQNSAATLSNVGGSVNSSATISFTVAGIDNRQGQISTVDQSAGDIILNTGGEIRNAAGNIGSDRNLSVSAQTLSGDGKVVAGQDAVLQFQGDFINTKENLISANRDLTFGTGGNFINLGNLEALRNLSLTAGSVSNQDGAVLNAGHGTTRIIAADTLYNLGRIYGDDIGLGAGRIINDGVLTADGATGRAGVIAARNSIALGAAVIVNQEHALIQSLGDLSVGGVLNETNQAVATAGTVLNSSATIDAGANLFLNTASLNNVNAHFATAVVDDPALTLHHVVEYQEEGSPISYAENQVQRAKDSKDGSIIILPGGKRVERYYRQIYDQTGQRTVVTRSDPALIQSGGDLILAGGNYANNQSAILAGGQLRGNINNLVNADAQGVIQLSRNGVSQYFYLDACGLFGEKHCDEHQPEAAYNASPVLPASLNVWRVESLSNLTHGVNNALGATVGNSPVPSGRAIALSRNQDAQQLSGDPQGIAGNRQTVGFAGNPIPDLTLPDTRLFALVPEPKAGYVIETDPKFTGYANFISSDYLLARLSVNPEQLQKRLGDGFYEQKLINDQIAQLTGRRFLSDYSSNEEQYRALMESGVKFAQLFQLTPGIALTASQMAALTSDMVWLVTQSVTMPDGSSGNVLVPVVYLANIEHLDPAGSVIAARDIDLSAEVRNAGLLQAANTTLIHGTDIYNTGVIRSDAATGTTLLVADNDLINSGGTLSGKLVGAFAGRDIMMETTTVTATGKNGSNISLAKTAGVVAGQLSMQAGRDVSMAAVAINTGSAALIRAGRDINLDSVTTRDEINLTYDSQNHLNQSQTYVNGTQVHSGGSLLLSAGRDLNAGAAYVSADQDLTAQAGHDINIRSSAQQRNYDAAVYTTHSGLLSSSSRAVSDRQGSTQEVASTFSGDTVQIVAGNDLNVAGSNIVASQDLVALAGNNISITTSADSSTQNYSRQEQTTGLFASGGVAVTYGSKSQANQSQSGSSFSNGSLIGSVSGNVVLQAGKDILVSGSDILAGKDATLLGRNIDIVNASNELVQSASYETHQSGITLSIGSPTVNAATSIAQSASRAAEVDDPRLKKLYAAKAATTALTNADKIGAELSQLADGNTGSISLNLSVGSSQSSGSSASQFSQVQGSQVLAGGNLNIVATGDANDSAQGNITIAGSRVAAANTTLAAVNDILLRSAQNIADNQSRNDSSGWSAGVGISLGAQTGITFSVSGNVGQGKSGGTGITQSNSQVSAGNNLTLISGGNTTLDGAVVSARHIDADIRGNLTISSPQDIEDYQSRQNNLGAAASFTWGWGGGSASVSASQSSTSADYASVNQQSGLYAGSGGYDINVGRHTQLDGGIIAGSAAPELNHLGTESLAFTDITNHKQFDSQANGFSAGTGSALYETAKSAVGALLSNANSSGNDTSLTRATISPGTVEIRNGDTAALDMINRDQSTASRALIHDDVQKIAQATQNSSEAGQVLANIGGQFADQAHAVLFDKSRTDNQLYRVVCRQEPCTYDPAIQTDPNRRDTEGNPNVQLVHITQDDIRAMTPEQRANVVVATNGIMNQPQRAGELALQNADAQDRSLAESTGNTKPDVILVNTPYSGNAISELMAAGYELFLKNVGGYTNTDRTAAETLHNVGLDNATALAHSRGSVVLDNALALLHEEGYGSDLLKVQVKGPAISQGGITETTNQLRSSDAARSANPVQYSAFFNDPVSTFVGNSPNGQVLPSLQQIINAVSKDNGVHSCYGTGTAGCAQIEKPYSYNGLDPAGLQKLRQEQVDLWLSQGSLYDPKAVVNPAGGLMPVSVFFQKNPVWNPGVAPVPVAPVNNGLINQLRDLQSQLQAGE